MDYPSQRDIEIKKQAEELADKFSKFVNCFDYKEDFFVKAVMNEHRTLQQGIAKIMFATIKEWAKQGNSGRYDLRNEETIKTCTAIDKFMTENKWEDWDKMPYI